MPWAITRTNDGIVVVTTREAYGPEMGRKLIEEVYAMNGGEMPDLVLIDHRAAQVEMGVVDWYERPGLYDGMRVNRRAAVATVFSILTANTRFYETVCQNRGYQFAVFDDIAAAREWLLSRGAPEAGTDMPI